MKNKNYVIACNFLASVHKNCYINFNDVGSDTDFNKLELVDNCKNAYVFERKLDAKFLMYILRLIAAYNSSNNKYWIEELDNQGES